MDLPTLIQECAPNVAMNTVTAIMRPESSFQPHAINVNGQKRLARQPRSREEAVAWSKWLINQGYSVDMGLMQINSKNIQRLGIPVEHIFEPCTNINTGAKILTENYGRAVSRYGQGKTALLSAVSAYNTGNFRDGFSNGYVQKVVKAANLKVPPLIDVDTQPAREPQNQKPNVSPNRPLAPVPQPKVAERPKETDPFSAHSEIESFKNMDKNPAWAEEKKIERQEKESNVSVPLDAL
jgi:type IV secretion system protein VirB1